MRSVWKWGQTDEKERGLMHPILLMAAWQRDQSESAKLGHNIFKLPYPGGSWYTEKRENQYLLDLMDLAWRTVAISIKSHNGEKLNKEEEKLLDRVAECL